MIIILPLSSIEYRNSEVVARCIVIRSTLVALTFLSILSTASLSQLAATPPSLRDVTMSGTAAWHMGSDDEKGTVTLKATRDGKSRMDLALGSDNRSEVRVNDLKDPHSFLLTEGKWKESAVHNSWSDANWFFPAFSAAAVGAEHGFTSASIGGDSLRAQLNYEGKHPDSTKLIKILSITDFDLDSATALPTRIRWTTHPEDDLNRCIPFEVRYSDYRDVKGVKVPFHIERYFNGTLQLEITVSSVDLNPGLSASEFSPMAK